MLITYLTQVQPDSLVEIFYLLFIVPGLSHFQKK